LVEHGLQVTKRMGIQEMVAMFLNMVGHGVGNRMIQERFQHSGETVSRHFHRVLVACLKLSFEYIKPQDRRFRDVNPKVQNDRRYWPFFENAIGAIDGTHIQCVVSSSEQPKFIGRKGYPTQNIMAVCDWDMCFTFALPGWEGTAHDARVFENALTTPTMNFPHPPAGMILVTIFWNLYPLNHYIDDNKFFFRKILFGGFWLSNTSWIYSSI
jgi:hypothetical protein